MSPTINVSKCSNYFYNKLQHKMTKIKIKDVKNCTFDIFAVGCYTALTGTYLVTSGITHRSPVQGTNMLSSSISN
jgi:hypothetical protein